MNSHPNETFRMLLQTNVNAKLASLRSEIADLLAAGDDASTEQAKFRRLRDLPATVIYPPDDSEMLAAVAALTPQWPVDLLPPLPEWFTDPVAAAAADPPGEVVVISLAPTTEEDAARATREMAEREYEKE